jgi:hypothetical protein
VPDNKSALAYERGFQAYLRYLRHWEWEDSEEAIRQSWDVLCHQAYHKCERAKKRSRLLRRADPLDTLDPPIASPGERAPVWTSSPTWFPPPTQPAEPKGKRLGDGL